MIFKELELSIPLRMRASKKGRLYSLNLNIYRNLHFQVLNNLKINFNTYIQAQLKDQYLIGKFKTPHVGYRFYADSNRATDLMNWISVIDKFLMDSLVQNGILIDDSTQFIKEIHCYYAGIDQKKGRVEVTLSEEVDEKN